MGKVKEHLCKVCGEADPENFYGREKSLCKVCYRIRSTANYEANLESNREARKQYALENKEAIRSYKKQYRLTSGGQEKEKRYRDNNKDQTRDAQKRYRQANRKTLRIKNNQYEAQRLKTDPSFKFLKSVRARQRYVLKGTTSTTKGLGCTSEELTQYLQSLFQEGMTLENHGEWHIDHILPLSSHDKDSEGNWCTDSEYNKKLIHYTNLQPLWAEDNFKKGNKIWHNLESDL